MDIFNLATNPIIFLSRFQFENNSIIQFLPIFQEKKIKKIYQVSKCIWFSIKPSTRKRGILLNYYIICEDQWCKVIQCNKWMNFTSPNEYIPPSVAFGQNLQFNFWCQNIRTNFYGFYFQNSINDVFSGSNSITDQGGF